MKKKYLKPTIVLCLVAILAIAGTIAYLTDVTEELVNDFTVDKSVDIDLKETEQEWELIPGESFAKDPTITVVADESYVFTKVVETMPTVAFTNNTTAEDDDRDFTYYVDYDINGLYVANGTAATTAIAGGTIYRADDTTTGIEWYWMLIETPTTVDDGTYTGTTDKYTTVTYKYALVDEYGKLLTVSSTDLMSDGAGGYIAAKFPILLNDTASIPETLTQSDLALFVGSEDVTYSADLAFTGYAIQTEGLDDLTTNLNIYNAAAGISDTIS